MKAPQPSLDPRKTPRQGRSTAAVEAIYEAAARILEQSGLAAFNTNLVAERAGVSVGSLYQYFPSKEAILAGLLRRKRSELLDDMRKIRAGHAALDFETVVERFIAAALHHQLDRPVLASALEYAEVILPVNEETAILKREIAAEVAGMLADRGCRDCKVAAQDITALARGMIDAAGLAGESDVDALAARVRAAVLGYLDRIDTGAQSPET